MDHMDMALSFEGTSAEGALHTNHGDMSPRKTWHFDERANKAQEIFEDAVTQVLQVLQIQGHPAKQPENFRLTQNRVLEKIATSVHFG